MADEPLPYFCLGLLAIAVCRERHVLAVPASDLHFTRGSLIIAKEQKDTTVRNIASLSCSTLTVALLLAGCSNDDAPSTTPEGGAAATPTGSSSPMTAGSGGGGSAAPLGGSAGALGTPGGSSGEGAPGQVGLDTMDGVGEGEGTSTGSRGELDAGGIGTTEDASLPAPPTASDTSMSFFVTSRGSGSGGDFGGILGADAFCTELATEASAELGSKTWRAYLSTTAEAARDRIGAGPWRNAAGVVIASSVAQLHDQGPTGEGGSLDQTWLLNDTTIALDEQGNPIANDGGTRHDILTGSNADGTVSASGTCSDWTSQQGTTRNGHSDRVRFMQNVPSWNSSHDTGCSEPADGANFQAGTVSQGGGRGAIYCFAID